MLITIYRNLNEEEKFLFLQVAANPIYQKLLQLHLEEIEEQILEMRKSREVSDSSYISEQEKLHERRQALLDLQEINSTCIAET